MYYQYICDIGKEKSLRDGCSWICSRSVHGEASLTFGHANANFSVFIDGIRNQFLKK